MSRPVLYSVHVDPRLPEPYESARFVKEGFSFAAFLFSSLWAFYHGLWFRGLLLLVYNLAVLYVFFSDSVSLGNLAVVDVAVHLIVGFAACDWLRARLERQGFLTADIACGDSLLAAQQRFFDRLYAVAPSRAPL